MKLHCLGTAGYHPNDARQTSCYFIPEISLMLDAGTGFYRVGSLLTSDTIDILLSHAHLDHVIGLTFVLDLIATTSLRKLRVHAEPEKIEAIRTHLFSELIFPIMPPIEFIPLRRQGSEAGCYPLEIAGGKGCWFPLQHPGGSAGFRIDWPQTSLAYITDTTAHPHADYWRLIHGVDLLLHECNFNDEYEEFAVRTGHSCLSPVMEGAKRAQIKHLVLTHHNPLDVTNRLANLADGRMSVDRSMNMQLTSAVDGMLIPLG